jgi:hypothetical protein
MPKNSFCANTVFGFRLMPRKTRADTIAAAVEISQASARPINPPSNIPLDETDLPFFASVIDEFARSEWTAHQLELAAMLARTMSDLEKDQRLMRSEGPIMATEKGTPVVNPRKTVIQMNASIILSFRRSLSLHARAQGGEGRDVGKRRGLMKEAEGEADGDDLLARPN